MMRLQRFFICLILFVSTALNTGCVTLSAAGAITGVGQYVKYAIDNISNQTFAGNLNQLTSGCINVFNKMKIQIDSVKKKEDGAKMYASANDLAIKVHIHSIPVITTKVTFDSSKYLLMKDKATAFEIISQIDSVLSNQSVLLGKREKI